MTTAFVTGAGGFVGRHIVDAILARGHEAICLVRSPSRAAHLARDGVRVVVGDLADISALKAEIRGCDVVFHAAACTDTSRAERMFAVNDGAVATLADACASLSTPPCLLHVSSLAAAGPSPSCSRPRVEEDLPAPRSLYGRSKREGELRLQERAAHLPVTIIRPGMVFGPHDTKVASIFRIIGRTGVHPVFAARSGPLSLVYVADLVNLILAAASRGERLAPGSGGEWSPIGTYLACDDRQFPTYGELGRLVGEAQGIRANVVHVPATITRSLVNAVQAIQRLRGRPTVISPDKLIDANAGSWAASARKARTHLGFIPGATLEARLRDTAEWLRGQA